MPLLTMKEILAEFDHVDDPDVVTRSKTSPALRAALEMSRPENWHGTGLSPDRVLPIATEDGIPVVWLPRADVLKTLVASPSGQRHGVLEAHGVQVIADCRARLGECHDPWIADSAHLLGKAIDAFDSGHHEAAMALAVSVGEPLALWASVPRVQIFDSEDDRDRWEKNRQQKKYKLASMELAATSTEAQKRRYEICRHALIAPVSTFFAEFRPGDPEPELLSRHVVAHAPTKAHFSRRNAIIALMLAVSILREQEEWCQEVRATDAMDDA